jgi:hypothetical protein
MLLSSLAFSSFKQLLTQKTQVVVFALSPWIAALGLHNMFTCVGCLALFLNMLVLPMIIWGGKFRIICAKRYADMAERQFDARAI